MEKHFEIAITGTEHHTWQGVLQTEEGPVPFRSERELLRALDRRLQGAQALWNDGSKMDGNGGKA